jgi:DNA-binding XRE family transcriptional regulator
MAKNIKLEEARLKHHLSLEEASRRLAVHKNTLLHWEMGRHKPQLSYLTALCKTYDATPEELGLEELVHSKQRQESVSPATGVTLPGEEIFLFEDLEVHLLTTIGQWNRRRVPYDGLQAMIDQQIRRYDDMTEQQKDGTENPERRKALRSPWGFTHPGGGRRGYPHSDVGTLAVALGLYTRIQDNLSKRIIASLHLIWNDREL